MLKSLALQYDREIYTLEALESYAIQKSTIEKHQLGVDTLLNYNRTYLQEKGVYPKRYSNIEYQARPHGKQTEHLREILELLEVK